MTDFLSIEKEVKTTRSIRQHLPKNIDLVKTASSIFLAGKMGVDTCLMVDYEQQEKIQPLLNLVNMSGGTLIEFPRGIKNLSRLTKNLSVPTRLIYSYSRGYHTPQMLGDSWEVSKFLNEEQSKLLMGIVENAVKRAKNYYADPLIIDGVTARLLTPPTGRKASEVIRVNARDFIEGKEHWQKRFQKLHDLDVVVTGSVLLSPEGTEKADNYAKLDFDSNPLNLFGGDELIISKNIAEYVKKKIHEIGLDNSAVKNLCISCSSPFLTTDLALRLTELPHFKNVQLFADDLIYGWSPFSSILDTVSATDSCVAILIDDNVSFITKVLK